MNKKAGIVAVVVALVIITATAVVGFKVFSDGPKEAYLKMESKNLKTLAQKMEAGYTEAEKQLEPLKDKPFKVNYEVGAKLAVSAKSQLEPETLMILGILEKSSISAETVQDLTSGQFASSINLVLNGAAPISLETFSDGVIEGARVPAFYDQYVIAKLADQKAFKEKFGFDMPGRPINSYELLETIKISQSELEPMLLEYAKIYADNLTEDQVQVTDNTSFKETGIQGKTYEVVFNKDQAKKLAAALSAKLVNDDKLLDLIYSKYRALLKIYEDAGIPIEETKSKDDFKEGIKKFASEELKVEEDSSGFQMIVQTDDQGVILSRQVVRPDSNKPVFEAAHWTLGDEENFNLVFVSESEENEGQLELTYALTKQDEKTKTGTVRLLLNEKAEETFEVISDFTYIKEGNTEELKLDFTLADRQNGQSNKLSGEYQLSQTKSDEGIDLDGVIKLNLDDLGELNIRNASLELGIKGEVQYNAELAVPQVTDTNSLNIVEATAETMAEYQAKILEGLQIYMMENSQLLPFLMPLMI